MKVAIVGSGISGLVSAHILSRVHDVTIYEARERLGGHTYTHAFERWGRRFEVDTGFIVFNPAHYPTFTRLLEELGVGRDPTTMSFAVTNQRTGLEYGTRDARALFCQPANAASPRFLRMLAEIARFYRAAPRVLEEEDTRSVGAYVEDERYGEGFRDDHLVPMASALWSCPAGEALEMPIVFLVRFMANHNMLSLGARPPWYVVRGGSSRYVEALRARLRAEVRVADPVRRVTRDADGVTIESASGTARADHVVIACHADEALDLLGDPSERERACLGAIRFEQNDVALHHDARLLPRAESAVSAWNAIVPADRSAPCTVSYGMNLLMGLESPEPFAVTLNRTDAIAEEKLIARMTYAHPIFTREGVRAASELRALSGERRTSFAGAYLGFGFHEDGARSAVEIARALGVAYP